MNDSIRLHRDRCKDESFLARADRGGVARNHTQRLGILESRRGLTYPSLDYRDTFAVSGVEGRDETETVRAMRIQRMTDAPKGWQCPASRYQARPGCKLGRWPNTPVLFRLYNGAVASRTLIDSKNDLGVVVTAGRDRQTLGYWCNGSTRVAAKTMEAAVKRESVQFRHTLSLLSASAYSLASRPMMAPDRRGELVSRFGHAGCGGIPHALTTCHPKRSWLCRVAAGFIHALGGRDIAIRTRIVKPTATGNSRPASGHAPSLHFSEESVQLRHCPHNPRKDALGIGVGTRLGSWCNRARRNNIPPVAQMERVLVF